MSRQKGVVLAIDKKAAIVLLDNGEYRKMSANGTLLIGQEVQMNSTSIGKYAAAAAIFLVVLVASIDFFNVVAYARLSPGIEVGMNRWERVVYAKPLSPGGQDALEGIETRGRKVEDVVAAVVDAAVKQDNSVRPITITIDPGSNQGSDKEKELVKKLSRAINNNDPDNLTLIRTGNHLTIKERPNKPDKTEQPSYNNNFDKSPSVPDKVKNNNNSRGSNGQQDPGRPDLKDKFDGPGSQGDRQQDEEIDEKTTGDRYQENQGQNGKNNSQNNKNNNNNTPDKSVPDKSKDK